MELTFFQIQKIRDFIYFTSGFTIDDERLRNIYKKKIENFIEHLGYRDFNSFYGDLVLKKDFLLQQKLINEITNNETYFLREKYQFETLVKILLPQIIGKIPQNETINILSAPCSTGEEVFSIAIYLMEEGNVIKKRDFALMGIDIDSNAIEKAKKGIYSQRSLYRMPEKLVDRYFLQNSNSYEIVKELKESVAFRVVNILDNYAMRRLGRFDIVFSRNMLIYFNEQDRKRAIATFYSILKPHGYLFLGHAERIPHSLKLFKQERIGESIVYKKV